MNALVVCPEQSDIVGYTHAVVVESLDFLVYSSRDFKHNHVAQVTFVRTQAPHLGDVGKIRAVEYVRQDLSLVGNNLFQQLNILSLRQRHYG